MSRSSDNLNSSSSEPSSSSSIEIVHQKKQRSRSRGHGQLKGQAEESTDGFSKSRRSRSCSRSLRKIDHHWSKKKTVDKYRGHDHDHQHLTGKHHLRARGILAKTTRGHHANAAHVGSRDLHHGIDQNGASPQKKSICLHNIHVNANCSVLYQESFLGVHMLQ